MGPEGEWHESAHYSQVSAFALTSFAVALKNAGLDDLFENENLKKWCLWLAQIYTPRDPMPGRGARRASPPIGRATAGVPWHSYVDYSVQGEDYRDLLQLRLDGEGDYFVVMFPRFRDQAAPKFTTLSEGTVIKLQYQTGTDYCFLPRGKTNATAERAWFRGVAGSVQDRPGGLVLATGAEGEVGHGDWALKATHAASLSVRPDRLTIQLSPDRQQDAQVTVTAKGEWKLAAAQQDVKLNALKQGVQLKLPAGVVQVVLVPL